MIYKNNIFFCDKKIKLKFIDSSRHLPFSLHKLTNYLSNKYGNNHDNSEEAITTLKKISYLCTNILVKTFYIY